MTEQPNDDTPDDAISSTEVLIGAIKSIHSGSGMDEESSARILAWIDKPPAAENYEPTLQLLVAALHIAAGLAKRLEETRPEPGYADEVLDEISLAAQVNASLFDTEDLEVDGLERLDG